MLNIYEFLPEANAYVEFPDLSEASPQGEIEALVSAGFHVLPCTGPDGKRPLTRSWNKVERQKFAASSIMNVLERIGSKSFGIRLDGLVVADCDNRHPDTLEWVEKHFPSTPFVVETPRGLHFYYRTLAPIGASTIRLGQVRVDVKSGHSHLVIAPGSVRPDGGSYRWRERGPATINDIPLLPHNFTLPNTSGLISEKISLKVESLWRPVVSVGSRNTTLVKKAVNYAAGSDSLEDLISNLMAARNIDFDDPSSFPDSEVRTIGEWAWKRRTENRLYAGARSACAIERSAVTKLLSKHGMEGSYALTLYTVLKSVHGHKKSAVFAVAIDAMSDKKLIPFTKSVGYRARQILIAEKLLIQVGRKQRGQPDQFRLGNALLLDEESEATP